MAANKAWISGSVKMLLLKLLSEKDMYGYEMITTLRKRSQNVFELKAGTLYPLLHTMEEEELLTSYDFWGRQGSITGLRKTGRNF